MKKLLLLVALILAISACQPAVETQVPATDPVTVDTPGIVATPTPTQTVLSFTPSTYSDEVGKFAFDYPDMWTLDAEQVIGDRGSQTLLLSPGSTAESIAQDGSRIVLMRYDWDPKNDLAARVAQRKTAWDASGFVILDESTRELEDGRAVVDVLMETPDKNQFMVSLTTIGDKYLEISAEGDLALCREILGTLRSID
jgi:hypothetical protein